LGENWGQVLQSYKKMSVVRQIKADEWGLLRSVCLAALSEAPYAFTETVEGARQLPDAEWQRRARSGAEGKEAFCVLGFEEALPIGIAVGLTGTSDRKVAYLISMWVAPSHRGTDLASSLVDPVMAWARGIGVYFLLAGITRGNVRAVAFYRKLGFEPYEGPIPNHPAISCCQVVLGKRLRT